MNSNQKILSAACLLLAILACNMPVAPPQGPSAEEQVATVVALTVLAKSTPTARNTPTNIPSPSFTPTITPTITPTYSLPLLKVNSTTNCRSGPGQDYDIVIALKPGDTAEIVGKYSPENYWIIKKPGGTSTCWIWGEYTTATGSYFLVPEMTPLPTATPNPPAPPRNLRYEYTCTGNGSMNNVTTSLNWDDRATNEKGYRILRNDLPVVELPPNSTTFNETITVVVGATISYSVEAFNDTGISPSSTISFTCS